MWFIYVLRVYKFCFFNQDGKFLLMVQGQIWEDKFKWMFCQCNFMIYFNLQIVDIGMLQLWMWWLLVLDKMEIMFYCFVLVGESDEVCCVCICLYEDFFNLSGFVMFDDNVMYEFCQIGYGVCFVGFMQGYV